MMHISMVINWDENVYIYEYQNDTMKMKREEEGR
jgi:hypothetical protein